MLDGDGEAAPTEETADKIGQLFHTAPLSPQERPQLPQGTQVPQPMPLSRRAVLAAVRRLRGAAQPGPS
eukprot:7182692-Alexandrium_andersonii.AAC.1